jgi:hypothetical protein
MPTWLQRLTPEQRAERERREEDRARGREVRGSGRDMASQIMGDLDERRVALIHERAALRSDPAYGYLAWNGRTNTVYDRAAWQRGRLVARFPKNAEERRETVSWEHILDREAQELGTTPDALIAGAERLQRQMHDLRRRTADLRADYDTTRPVVKELRSADRQRIEFWLDALRD